MKPLARQPSQTEATAVAKPRLVRRWTVAVLWTLVLVVVTVLGLLYRQRIIDQVRVWRFTPTSELVALAERAGLNNEGKFYLYASETQIDDRSAFNKACGKLQNEKTVVIGCYVEPDKRIYVFDVTDPRLDGVKETSAAHEMLHAAYARLWPQEKQRVDALLNEQKAHITDKRITDLLHYYEESEPGDVVNELHSIFATEVENLSPALEQYYSRYFSDRLAVVRLKNKYEHVFTDLATRQQQLVADMASLTTTINTRQRGYDATTATLNNDIVAFNAWALSGRASRTEYDIRRAALQARIDSLNAVRDEVNAQISIYNEKKTELDALNLQASSLNQSIDSKLAPTPSL